MSSIICETERLIIKNVDTNDAKEIEAICELEKDPEVMRFIGSGARTDDEIWHGIHRACKHYEMYGFTSGSVFEKETGNFIGRAGLFHHQWDNANKEIEVGYRFLKQYWGKGYATEIVEGLLKYGFEKLNCQEICAAVFADNHVSARVLKKCGAKYMGMITYWEKYQVEKYIFENKIKPLTK